MKHKQLIGAGVYDFSMYQHLKADLQTEIQSFLSISINMHTIKCLHVLGIQGFQVNQNSYVNNRTIFSHYIEEAETKQTEGIHNVQQAGVNREVGCITLKQRSTTER